MLRSTLRSTLPSLSLSLGLAALSLATAPLTGCQRSGDWNDAAERVRLELAPGDVVVLVPKREAARVRAFPNLPARASDDPGADGSLDGARRAWIVREASTALPASRALTTAVRTFTHGGVLVELFEVAATSDAPPAWDFVERFDSAELSGGEASLQFGAPNAAAGAVRCIHATAGTTLRWPLVTGGTRLEGRLSGDAGARLVVRLDDAVKGSFKTRKADWTALTIDLPKDEPVLAVAFTVEEGTICFAASVAARP